MIRLLLPPSAVTLAFLAFVDLRRIHFETRWQAVEAVLIVACAIYLALRLYFGDRGPADTIPGNPRENLAGCAGGLLLVGAVVTLGAAVLGEGLLFGSIAALLLAGYVAAQFMLWPALLKALLAYVAITRGVELVLLVVRYSPTELRDQAGWAAVAVFGTVLYGAWFGMIAAATADRLSEWVEDRRERRRAADRPRERVDRQRAAAPPVGGGRCDICGNAAAPHPDATAGRREPMVIPHLLFRRAVERGFDPFAAGLVAEETRAEWSQGESSDPLDHWRRVWVDGSSSDWLLCPSCLLVFQEVLEASELRQLGLSTPR